MKFLSVISDRSTQFSIVCLATTALVGANAIVPPPSRSVPTTLSFVCDKVDGVPATVARTKKVDVPIVVWRTENFGNAGYPPKIRCQQVSARFQKHYSSGRLRYITAGSIENYPVICATREKTDNCTQQNLLLMLKVGENPQSFIKKLTVLRCRASIRNGIVEDECFSTSDTAFKSIDVEWLEEERD